MCQNRISVYTHIGVKFSTKKQSEIRISTDSLPLYILKLFKGNNARHSRYSRFKRQLKNIIRNCRLWSCKGELFCKTQNIRIKIKKDIDDEI